MTGNVSSKTLAARLAGWQWILLGVVVLGALAVRAHDLSRIFLWMDEMDFFNEKIYRIPPQALLDFVISTRHTTTNTWGWPIVIWVFCRLLGATPEVARMPAVLAGTGAVLMVFFLVYHLLPEHFDGSRFIPAITAALLGAISILQMEFSQRTYPYAGTPLMAAVVLLAHTHLLRAISQRSEEARGLFRAVAVYTLACSLAVCTHPSLGLLVIASLVFLTAHAFQGFSHWSEGQRKHLIRLGFGMICVIGCMALLNRKNPKYGFRVYLQGYYHEPSLHSIPRLLMHAYDVATYQLNIAYNTSLYLPERLNIVLLPLVLLCVLGWVLAVRERFGSPAKHLALLGAATTAMPALLSFVKVFPFGGIRQMLFLSPFFLVFTALGFYALRAYRATRIAAGLAAAFYLALWGFNLPRFYDDRLMLYTTDDLQRAWRENGQVVYYCQFCRAELQYMVRDHQEIVVKQFSEAAKPPSRFPAAKPPYLLVSTRFPVGDNPYFSGFLASLRQTGYKITLLEEKLPKHPESWDHSGSLYFPPHGLFVYKVTE